MEDVLKSDEMYNMHDFPNELIIRIFSELDAETCIRCALVCKSWFHVSKTQELWRFYLLRNWPSQRWLYKNATVYELNWYRCYKELKFHSLYSPDQMKYLITCNIMENELISPTLREAFFRKVEIVSQKWCQASVFEYGLTKIPETFNKNMELYFDTKNLEWTFLDKRRSYLQNFSSFGSNSSANNNSQYVRPYQVIPSCLLMYRWLCIFRSFAVSEPLTFYRIWRFRLKHLETGLIFELCDWKAAMSSSFSNGKPKILTYRNDALELLQLLTHPHFVMQPVGIDPSIEKTFHHLIHATAGGDTASVHKEAPRVKCKKRKNISSSTSPRPHSPFNIASKTDVEFPDIEEKLKKWREKRNLLSLSSIDKCSTVLTEERFSRQSSSNSLLSETESDELQFESSSESDIDFYESGYITNCEYFISSNQSFDTIEEQHSIQASIADLWISTKQLYRKRIAVHYDIEESSWYMVERTFHGIGITDITDNADFQSKYMKLDNGAPCFSHGENNQDTRSCCNQVSSSKLYEHIQRTHNNGIIQPIPSALALYR